MNAWINTIAELINMGRVGFNFSFSQMQDACCLTPEFVAFWRYV